MKRKHAVSVLVGYLALLGIGVVGVVTIGLARAQTAAAAITEAPQLSAPANGSTLTTYGPTLQWRNPTGTTQYHLQVIPINNDGPGVNVIIGSAGTSFDIPAPPDWYGLLPDMTYTWRVRATDATVSLSETDSAWGPWSGDFTFRTPKTASSSVTLVNPVGGVQMNDPTPVLTWSNSDTSIFYYEVQVSKDQTFNTDPATATASIYWELRHGGAITPPNSYTIPANAPLENNTTYYWRVRPRVQGDGTPLAWTPAASFKIPAATALFLQVTAPTDESIVNSASVQVTGKTQPGALVTVNETLVTADAAGNFSASVSLTEGPNAIYIIASNSAGDVISVTRTVTYIP